MCIILESTHSSHIEKSKQEQNTFLQLTRRYHKFRDCKSILEDSNVHQDTLGISLLHPHRSRIKRSSLVLNNILLITKIKDGNIYFCIRKRSLCIIQEGNIHNLELWYSEIYMPCSFLMSLDILNTYYGILIKLC